RLVALPAGSVIRELSALSAQRRLAFSPNGMLLASAGDTAERRVHLWRVADGEPLYAPFLPYEQGSGPVSTLAFTGDSTRLMVAGGYEDIPIWNVSEGVRIGSLQTFSRETPSLAFSADSGLLWTSSPNRGWLRAFDVATGALVAAPMRLAEGIQSFAFHPNRPILATTPSSPNAVRLWDLTTGEMFLSLPARVILGFAPEGELLWTLGSPNNTIAAWRLMPDGIRLQALFGGNGAATVDAQGMLIAQIQDGWLNLWDARTGQLLRQLPNAPYSTVQHIRISPNRRYVACTQTGFNELPVWNLETGEQYVLPLPLSNNPLTVAFSPDEEFIATTTHDQYLRLWRLRDRRLVGEYFDLIFRESAQLMFSPNGRYLALARRDGTIAVLRNPFFPDLNGDGSVDDTDLLEVLFAFGATGENLAADVNRDGSVDDADLLMVLFYFGQ
ncbi:MAG: dockerin type I domain-containing protein, partial [Fimbriimonadales bacterium]|nr:dockerin type I domain-containing protein [Fimbriimonadales bacterium]